MCGKSRYSVDQTDVVFGFLAETQDPARADVDAGVANVRESLQSLVVSAGGDDGGVVLAGSVDIVVVCRQSGSLQLFGL